LSSRGSQWGSWTARRTIGRARTSVSVWRRALASADVRVRGEASASSAGRLSSAATRRLHSVVLPEPTAPATTTLEGGTASLLLPPPDATAAAADIFARVDVLAAPPAMAVPVPRRRRLFSAGVARRVSGGRHPRARERGAAV